MSDFAIEIGPEDIDGARELLSRMTEWNQPPGHRYWTAEATPFIHDYEFLIGCARAFFIKMEPGTNVYRHRDPREVVENFNTDHIVVSTNDESFICWQDEDGEHSVHLDLGKRYRIIDRGVMHWAVNFGDTDRVHLLIEYPRR